MLNVEDLLILVYIEINDSIGRSQKDVDEKSETADEDKTDWEE